MIVTLGEYLKKNNLTLSEFATIHGLNYSRLFRVKQGGTTKDKAINCTLKALNITTDTFYKKVDPTSSFLTQECICINHEKAGDIYCHYRHQLEELEAYLSVHQIPYYVRKLDDCWVIKYDKEAEMNKGEF